MANKIKLQNVRINFPSLFRKAVFDGNETGYECTFILDKKDNAKTIKEIQTQIEAMVLDKFKGKAKSLQICLRDGDETEIEHYQGKYTIKAKSNQRRPLVIDRDRSPINEEDGLIYSGAYCNAIITLFSYDKIAKGVSAGLTGVQFVKHGETFADNVGSVNDFDLIDEEDEAEDMPWA